MFIHRKKRVLILGDSYARNKSLNPINGPAWTELLRINRKYQVTNLAEGGSCMWFSFRNFLNYHEKHDKIIFVVTNPLRLYFPIYEDIVPPHHNPGTLDLLLDIKKTTTNSSQIENIDAVLSYFKHIVDMEEISIYQKLMIKEIRQLRPDTILIPAFPNSIFDYQSDCLMDVSDREVQGLGISMYNNIFETYDEQRNCHLIDENNHILYKHVLHWLDGAPVVIDKNNFKKMKRQDFDRYLKLKT